MPFVNLIRNSPLSRLKCSMSIFETTAIIRIGRGFADRLGWDEDARIMISAGVDEDAGIIRLTRHQDGWVLRSGHKSPGKPGNLPCSSYILRFSHRTQSSKLLPQMPETMEARAIKVEMIGDGLRFRMPWLPAAGATAPSRGLMEVRHLSTNDRRPLHAK
jgi:hypothetical protein